MEHSPLAGFSSTGGPDEIRAPEPPELPDQPFSVTVVLGERFACPFVTYRPEMALRYALPLPMFEADSTTEVRGWRTATAFEMYFPLIALRARPPELFPRAMGPPWSVKRAGR
jgi:hypothetical protein